MAYKKWWHLHFSQAAVFLVLIKWRCEISVANKKQPNQNEMQELAVKKLEKLKENDKPWVAMFDKCPHRLHVPFCIYMKMIKFESHKYAFVRDINFNDG